LRQDYKATALADEIQRAHPMDTIATNVTVPLIRAIAALYPARSATADPVRAVDLLNAAVPYARASTAVFYARETADDGSSRLHLYSRSKFVMEVFGMAIQAKAMIVGFNLPFDLSRLALDWEIAESGGWSLILSQWRNPDTGQLQANKFFPRIVVNALNSKTSIIYSTRAPLSEPGKRSKRSKLWPVA
jgi:hypothetical protein